MLDLISAAVTHPRARIALMVAGTIGLLAVAAAVIAIDPGAPAGSGSGYEGSVRPPGPPAAFVLRDEHGDRISPTTHRGRPVVVTFMYTTCEDDCPTMAQQIRGALDDLGSDAVPVIAVSVDPRNDTRGRAQRFISDQSLGGRMHFALGDEAALQPVWRQFGIQPQEQGREHSAWVVLLDADGRQRVGFPVDKLTSEGLQHDVLALLREQRSGAGT
jgi:protein SCO1/2